MVFFNGFRRTTRAKENKRKKFRTVKMRIRTLMRKVVYFS